MSNLQVQSEQGSVGLGFLAGLFGGCLGLTFVFALGKGPDTKKGVLYGLIAQVVIGVVVGFVFTQRVLR